MAELQVRGTAGHRLRLLQCSQYTDSMASCTLHMRKQLAADLVNMHTSTVLLYTDVYTRHNHHDFLTFCADASANTHTDISYCTDW